MNYKIQSKFLLLLVSTKNASKSKIFELASKISIFENYKEDMKILFDELPIFHSYLNT